MIRRVALIAALVALASAAGSAHAAPTQRIGMTEAGGATFPERAFVLDLPSARASLTPDQVSVTENGNQVIDETLVPAGAAGKTAFGVVLLVDTSESMAGAPIGTAMAAARAFAAQRNPNEQVAFVTFDSTTHLVLPLTTSTSKISAALAQTPKVSYGTHMFDAVGQAESMLSSAGIGSGSIVVLSDGADTGSAATAKSVAAAARAQHVKLFAIGLRDSSFRSSALTELAQLGGGQYSSAESKTLAAVFDQLGVRLSREYLLRYKSLAGPHKRVRVSVDVAGVGSGSSAYRTPALPVSIPSAYHPSLASRFWGSTVVMVILALLLAGGLALLVVTLLRPRQSGLPRRMSEFVSVPGLQTKERAESAAPEPGYLARLGEELEIAQINTSATTLVAGTIAATVLLFGLLTVVLGSFWWGLLALALPFGVRSWEKRKLARRRDQFAEQLPDCLQVIGAALRAGHSFAGALAVVVERASDPMRSEMQRVVADEQRGVPLEDAIQVVVRRMDNRDLEQVALVAQLQRQAGGNAAEVIDRVAETIRERFELRRLIKTLTVQGRMSRWIVTALPIALVVILSLLNHRYLHPLVSNLFGKVLIGFAVALLIAGSLVIKRIVEIKV